MILMKTEKACGRCPKALLCMTLTPLEDVARCRRCHCVTFKYNDTRFMCTLLRGGVHSRCVETPDAVARIGLSPTSKRNYVISALAPFRSCVCEGGCVKTQRKKRPAGHRGATKKYHPWRDCVHCIRETSGFDLEL